MAGRALIKTRMETERLRAEEARSTPTPARLAPIDYSPELCTEVMELALGGFCHAEVAAHWCISEETLTAWENAHIEFKAASQRARTRAKAWWQRQPRIAIAEGNNKFPAGAWAQQVRALFPEYDDKSVINVHLDLGSLVRVAINLPELPGQQMVGDPKSLIEGECVQLGPSQTLPKAALPHAPAGSEDEGAGPRPEGEAGVGEKP